MQSCIFQESWSEACLNASQFVCCTMMTIYWKPKLMSIQLHMIKGFQQFIGSSTPHILSAQKWISWNPWLSNFLYKQGLSLLLLLLSLSLLSMLLFYCRCYCHYYDRAVDPLCYCEWWENQCCKERTGGELISEIFFQADASIVWNLIKQCVLVAIRVFMSCANQINAWVWLKASTTNVILIGRDDEGFIYSSQKETHCCIVHRCWNNFCSRNEHRQQRAHRCLTPADK